MEHFFDSREAASVAAARHIETALLRQLEQQPEAAVVVGGGTSPVRCLGELANSDIAWGRLQVLLSDERWVPSQDEDSNEQMIRQNLLQGKAADAHLWPMYDASASIEEQCEAQRKTIRGLQGGFACALLGMGEDGHFASLFPDAGNLADGLDIESESLCLPISTAASQHLRISLTLAALLQSQSILLLFFGDAKRSVYEHAKENPTAYPVSRLLSQQRVPVHVFWAS